VLVLPTDLTKKRDGRVDASIAVFDQRR